MELLPQRPPGFHTTPYVAWSMVLNGGHNSLPEREEGTKFVAGKGKKNEIWAGPAEGSLKKCWS